jgi:hypothetical protein
MKSILLISMFSMSVAGTETRQCQDGYCFLSGRPVVLGGAKLALEMRAGTTILVPTAEIGYIVGGRFSGQYGRWSVDLAAEAMLSDSYQRCTSFNGDASLGLTGRLGIGYWLWPDLGLEAGLSVAVFDLGGRDRSSHSFILPDVSVVVRRGRLAAAVGWMIGAGAAPEAAPHWQPATGLRLRLAYEF